jgi:hypothetical protein
MYLFTRRGRLTDGNGTAGFEWAGSMCEKVRELTGQEVQLWATVHSPGWGTITWTAWMPDLSTLERLFDTLQADSSYIALTDQGAKYTAEGADDELIAPVHGEPDPERDAQYVGAVRAVCAAGSIARAMGKGIEIADKAASITGLPTMFVRSMSGPYGGVGWLTGYDDLAQYEKAQQALAEDQAWMALVDSTEGCFVEDPAVTQATLYRRLA